MGSIKKIVVGCAILSVCACSGSGRNTDLAEGASCKDGNGQCVSGTICYQDGFCRKLCSIDEHCEPTQKCSTVCIPVENPQCFDDEGCKTNVPQCSRALNAKCVGARCVYLPKEDTESCDDDNPCTVNDHCDGQGSCIGEKDPCNQPPNAACSPDNGNYISYIAKGSCDPAATEGCVYQEIQTPCENCADNCLKQCADFTCEPKNNGCSIGTCKADAVNGPSCQYANADNGTTCTTAQNTEGQCRDGQCISCLNDDDCFDKPGELWPECFSKRCNNGTCEYNPFPGPCGGSCVNGVLYDPGECQNDGSCKTTTHSCGAFKCNANNTDCIKSCTDDTVCQDNSYCIAGQCKKMTPCFNDTQCGDGQHCLAAIRRCTSGGIGDICEDDGDCDQGHHCRQSTGICVDGISGCDDNGDCDDYLRCYNNKCQSGSVGQPCQNESDCNDSNLFCKNNALGEKICSRGQDGDYCDSDKDCMVEYHDPLTNQILDKQTVWKNGLTGTVFNDGYHCQQSIHQCVSGAPAYMKDGSWVKVSTCDDHDDCDFDHRCYDGYCQHSDFNSPCVSDDQCSSMHGYKCVNGLCTGRHGSSCNKNSDCFGGLCDTLPTGNKICCMADSDGSDSDGPYNSRQGHCCNRDTDCQRTDLHGKYTCDTELYICRAVKDGTCDYEDSTQDSDFHCRLSTHTWVTGQPGDKCDDDLDCDAGHHCRQSLNVCTTGAIGSGCDDDGDCDIGHHCRQSSHTCVSGVPIAVRTAQCTSHANCIGDYSYYCGLGGYCTNGPAYSATASDTDYTCQQKYGFQAHLKKSNTGASYCVLYNYGSGSECDDDNDCDSTYRCSQKLHICIAAGQDMHCEQDNDCYIGHGVKGRFTKCIDGTCTGEAGKALCQNDDECYGGLCTPIASKNYYETDKFCCFRNAGGINNTTHCCAQDSDCNDLAQKGLTRCDKKTFSCVNADFRKACSSDRDCTGNVPKCVQSNPNVIGYCDSGSLGADCVDDDDCYWGYCIQSRHQCSSGTLGALCDDSADCDTHSCNYLTHKCQAGNAGDICKAATDCNEMYKQLYCPLVAGVCTSGQLGEPCDSSAQCSPSSPFCVSDAPVTGGYNSLQFGHCFDGALDSPCEKDSDCQSGLKCISQAYHHMKICGGANGSFCNTDNECGGGLCSHNTCCTKDTTDINLNCCNDDSHCASGYICDTSDFRCIKQ